MPLKINLIIGVILLGPAACPQSVLPPAPRRHIVTVSPPGSRGNEPSIAVNPNNPKQVVAAFQHRRRYRDWACHRTGDVQGRRASESCG